MMTNVFKKLLIIIISMLIMAESFFLPIQYSTKVLAEDVSAIDKQIEEQKDKLGEVEDKLGDLKKKSEDIDKSIKDLSGQINVTNSQISNIQGQIASFGEEIDNLTNKLTVKNSQLGEKRELKNVTIRNLYIKKQRDILSILISNKSLLNNIENLVYHKRLLDSSEKLIGDINNSIKKYDGEKAEIETLKQKAEKQRADLSTISKNLNNKVKTFKDELANISQSKLALEQERNEINKKLSELSAAQKGVLEEKTDTFTASVGDVPASGEPTSRADYDPGFSPAFAGFSFGAPHRKGMSQYGAKGRAESGQDYKEILRGYYGNVKIEKPDIPDTIRTDKGDMDIDGKYLKGLAEMPASWPMDALKAQAIAARTYALSYVGWRNGNGSASGRICTTESCQVWSSSKASSSSAARWHEAVESTKGMVMLSEDTDNVFSSWYAASSGGYNFKYTSLSHTTRGGWDTKCSSKDCWTKDAFESIGGSPWFYKGWYKSRGGKSCGRSHPWLKENEFADIVGAVYLYTKDKDNQKHLSQLDANKCYGKSISDTWSMDEVQEKSGITEVSEVKVSYSSGGSTAEVKVKTNKGELTFSGDDFKAVFNLRAPSMIQIKSSLYNIEYKK